MRGALILLLVAGILFIGCTQQPSEGNETNPTNNTPPVQTCSGPVCGSDNKTYGTDCEAVLANVSVLYTGECQAEEGCSDSDGGMNISIAGNVTLGNQTFADQCDADGNLLEYTCGEGNLVIVVYDCGDAKECDGGRCADKPAPPLPNVTPNVTPGCSGPLVADIYARESVTFNGSIYNDTCIEYKVVKDYFCEDGRPQSISHECPPGYSCQAGQCNKLYMECNETDAGNDTSVRGRTTVIKGLLMTFDEEDECIDEGMLKEYYCLPDNTAAGEEMPCPSGTKCLSGRCVESDCSDTDGGLNIYKKGVAEDAADSYEDYCLNSHVMREYFCYGDDARSDLVDCGEGYICNEDTQTCIEGSVGY